MANSQLLCLHTTLRKQILITFFAIAFVAFVQSDNSASSEDSDVQKKAKEALDKTVTGAKAVGGAIAESTATHYNATKEYFNNRTVGDVAGDVADGAKKVGTAVADKAKAGYDATKDYFSNKTAGDVADDVKDGAKTVGTKIADGAKGTWETVKGWFS